ncbi:MAG: 16S rRNA (adenine(1518)-N(6)/adenine(1519)-N(6))-dimethyltransferase RsmA [Cytophagales bacterium]|nr:16S rRNA (adenine(1518)-N(6)/adenine(1519)-N(6))-dimethyltransferase RsmA [Bernardetiaceae bacterium]MDW8210950.1 16S rRNA (adenine(1518)-N(6)/adenine(1519)-N(6))-dimethyltransferase RsmA [Cytophagales bacterium]
MKQVKPKKYLGQHFLRDLQIARQIVGLLSGHGGYRQVVEIGPGMGALTQFLVQNTTWEIHLAEIDREAVAYLAQKHFVPMERLHHLDFLSMNLANLSQGQPLALIGNLPYQISSPIFFKLLENRHIVSEMVCMVQKEVAERITAAPGNKTYGILSVLLQAFYHVRYEFTVDQKAFQPPPKVKSAVIVLQRNQVERLPCNEKKFFQTVKTAFNQRRKTLRNALKPLGVPSKITDWPWINLRAEQLSVEDFVALTTAIERVS